MAIKISQDYADRQVTPLVIVIMNGGLITAGHLLNKITIPVDIDYCHATRYGQQTNGGDLHWLAYPQQVLTNRSILLVDDIFDEGITLKYITQYCKENGAKQVSSAVLLNKIHNRKVDGFSVDYTALSIADSYVFGFGLDYKGAYRNAPGIFKFLNDLSDGVIFPDVLGDK